MTNPVFGAAALTVDESGANPVQGVRDGQFQFSHVGSSAVAFRVDRPFLCVFHHGESVAMVAKIVSPMPCNA